MHVNTAHALFVAEILVRPSVHKWPLQRIIELPATTVLGNAGKQLSWWLCKAVTLSHGVQCIIHKLVANLNKRNMKQHRTDMRCLHIKCRHCLHTETSIIAQIHKGMRNTCACAISLRATENCALVRPSPDAGAASLDLSQIYIYTASYMPSLSMHTTSSRSSLLKSTAC